MPKRKDTKGRVLRSGESQRKDGQYEYRYTDLQGRRHSVYSWKLVDTDRLPEGKRSCLSLREKEKEVEIELIDGIDPVATKKMTIAQCFELYMKACPGLKESTRVVKRNIYDSYIKISLGNIKISDIRYNHLLSYLQELLYSSNLSSGTVHSTFQLLSLLYDNAIRNKIIRDNLPRLILSDLQSQHPNMWAYQPREALTRDEQNAFISFCRTSRKRNVQRMRPLVTLLLGTGLRIGEALGLTWADCNFKAGTISVNHTLRYGKRESSGHWGFSITSPKTTSGIRTIPMFQDVRTTLMSLHDRQIKNPSPFVEIDGFSGFIFRKRSGNPFDGTSVTKALHRIVEIYNQGELNQASKEEREPIILPTITPHVLRHTFCTRLCEQNTNLKVVQNVMGHASASTTMNIYNHLQQDALFDSFNALEGHIGPL